MSSAERSLASLTGRDNYFEDFEAGQQIRHARGATVDEVENQLLTKLVMNTAQSHWNEDAMTGTGAAGLGLGEGRLVFGLVTGSMVMGLASQDVAENALAELGVTGLKFTSPVHHGDTIYAFTEVLATEDTDDDAGVVRFKHWGTDQHGTIVFEGERTVLVKKRAAWADR
ncbi:MAG: MaoC family dehydratase [Actinomycetia bacterium]|nr:MaoC family dehydratase [Actinomycetes bacterium]